MDLMNFATTLATIVGLLSNFKAERGAAQLEEFIEWLRIKSESDLATAIERNEALANKISAVLTSNHEDTITRLSALEDSMAQIAASFNGFGDLAEELHHTPAISEQAMSIIRQMVASKAEFAQALSRWAGAEYIFVNGAQGQLEFSEPQFAEEDIEFLISRGFLRPDRTSKGALRISLTRAAHALAASHPSR